MRFEPRERELFYATPEDHVKMLFKARTTPSDLSFYLKGMTVAFFPREKIFSPNFMPDVAISERPVVRWHDWEKQTEEAVTEAEIGGMAHFFPKSQVLKRLYEANKLSFGIPRENGKLVYKFKHSDPQLQRMLWLQAPHLELIAKELQKFSNFVLDRRARNVTVLHALRKTGSNAHEHYLISHERAMGLMQDEGKRKALVSRVLSAISPKLKQAVVNGTADCLLHVPEDPKNPGFHRLLFVVFSTDKNERE